MARASNSRVNGQPTYHKAAPIFQDGDDNRVCMVVVGNSYSKTREPLHSCAHDAWCVESLASFCGVTQLTKLYDLQCTKDALLSSVATACSQCKPDDYFVLYFSGYGADAPSTASMEEVFVCTDTSGQMSPGTLLGDAELSATILASCHPEVRIIFIVDTCHPGTIVNLSSERWAGRQAVSISGSRERRTSKEPGRGGMFTQAMLLAVAKLARVGHEDYSVGALYNATLREAEDVFMAWQDITIQCALGLAPGRMAWPLVPELGYEAPLSLYKNGSAQQPSQVGLQPEMLNFVKFDAVNAPVSIEEYVSHVVGSDADKGLRSCTTRATRACYGPDMCCMQ